MIEVRPVDGGFALSGTLDSDSVSELLERIEKLLPARGAVEVDLAGLDRVDSAGVAGLLWLKTRGAREGRSITYRSPGSQLKSLAAIAGVRDLL